MTDLRTAAQQALEALKSVALHRPNDETNNAIIALRAALAEPVQEPQLKRIHPLDMPLEVFVEDLSGRPRTIINAEMRYFTHSGDEYIKPPLTVRHLLMFSRKELRKWPNLGKRSLNEIEEMLRNRGLQLWDEHDERSLRLLREHPTYFRAALAEPVQEPVEPEPPKTAWAHLPNAVHIDRIVAHVKEHPEKWAAGYDKKSWKAAWVAVYDTARDEALDAAREAVWAAARGATVALIAWDDAGELFSQPIEAVKARADEGECAAVLLYPAMVAMREDK